MNPRERRMAIIVGVGLGAALLYYGGRYLFHEPYKAAQTEIVNKKKQLRDYERLIASREGLAERWNRFAARTASHDPLEAANELQRSIPAMLERNRLKLSGPCSPLSGAQIGERTGIRTVAVRASAEGRYADVVGFLRELYASPRVFQVTKLILNPVHIKGVRDRVKIDLHIETPVLPRIKAIEVPEAAAAQAQDELEQAPRDPLRVIDEGKAYATLSGRNIFRQFEPPPTNVVTVDNQDRLPVRLSVEFQWDDAVEKQPEATVGGKSKQPLTGKGDVAIVTAIYADGKTLGPQRFDAATRQPWSWTIPPHTPPEVVDLAVDNQHEQGVEIVVTVTDESGKTVTKPTMRINAATKMDVEVYKAATVTVAATYPSGRPAKQETFRPREGKQFLVVPVERPDEPVQTAGVEDAPADVNLAVTGLLTYPNMHEMIAMNSATQQRQVICTGEAVDGGVLLGVHPTFGGVVLMRATGNYYLYPLGKKFTERILLDARTEDEVPAAIESAMSAMLSAAR